MRNAAFPFLTIPDEHVSCTGWMVELSSRQTLEDPEFIEHWDNATDLTLSRSLEVDLASAARALQVPVDELNLEAVVLAGTGGRNLPVEKWLACRTDVNARQTSAELQFVIQGTALAEVLHLHTALVLARPEPVHRTQISPSRAGDIVWRDLRRMRLEGDVSRFPVTVADLEAMLGKEARDALWFLDASWSDASADFDACVRLYVNKRARTFTERFQDADGPTLQSVMADVMVQLMREWITRNDELEEVAEGADVNSLAGVVDWWVDITFGSIQSARESLERAPGHFHARLNAAAAGLQGGEG